MKFGSLNKYFRPLLILIISFFTFIQNYQYPNGLFWDENYHIPAAEKYITHTTFVEPHPPLGKLLIALGEIAVNPNSQIDKSYFVDTDYIREVPQNYSFAGVRLFPSLLGALASLIFFNILVFLTKNPFLSFVFSLAYLFDNAIIVHFRGAMLDSILIFNILLTIYRFFRARYANNSKEEILYYFLTGVGIALSTATKLSGLFLIILLIPLTIKNYKLIVGSLIATFVVFFSIFYIHFYLGDKINPDLKSPPLPSYYQQIIKEKKNKNPLYTPLLTYYYIRSSIEYNKGVPKFKGYDNPEENGSLPMDWPLGIKSINYRWEKTNDGKVKYLYLQINPIVRSIGLIGIILAFSFSLTTTIFKPLIKFSGIDNYVFNVKTLTFLYMSYMGGMILIPRVMYLYHYFPALIVSLLLAGLIIDLLFRVYNVKKSYQCSILSLLSMFIILVWYIYSPLTYFKPIKESYFNKINIFKLWYLKPIKNPPQSLQ